MRVTRPGAKDNRIRLAWTKYYKYTLDNKEYYFKQKAYTTYCDGWIKTEAIKKETYIKATKRGNECIEISQEDIKTKEYIEIIKVLESYINSKE